MQVLSKESVRRSRIALLGFGAVGQAFTQQVVDSRGALLERRGLALDVMAICDRSGLVCGRRATQDESSSISGSVAVLAGTDKSNSGEPALVEPLDDELLCDLVKHKAGGAGLASHERGEGCGGAAAMASLLPYDAVLVDCTATGAVTPTLLDHLDHGGAVVLANKLPLSGTLDEYDAFEGAAAEGRAAWEATVGSGVPIIAALRRMIDADDVVTRIEGTFSGTLNFVATELRRGRSLSEIVAEARALRFTEPDPRADLGGLDMARKALILARMLGWRLDLDDVGIEGLYPRSMDAMDVEEFMAALPSLDAEVRDRVETASSHNAVFRHIARIADGRCSVGPAEVPADSPLGRLVGTDNLVTFHSRWYDPTPLIIQGRGAGVNATAAAVLADVVAIAVGQGHAL